MFFALILPMALDKYDYSIRPEFDMIYLLQTTNSKNTA